MGNQRNCDCHFKSCKPLMRLSIRNIRQVLGCLKIYWDDNNWFLQAHCKGGYRNSEREGSTTRGPKGCSVSGRGWATHRNWQFLDCLRWILGTTEDCLICRWLDIFSWKWGNVVRCGLERWTFSFQWLCGTLQRYIILQENSTSNFLKYLHIDLFI